VRFALAKPHNWLIFAVMNPAIEEAVRAYARGRLADIGCGSRPYRTLCSAYVREQIGFDLAGGPGVDFPCVEAYHLPVPDESFDTVLCTDVLEHLEEPSQAVKEAMRILKPGGVAIYTTPLFWHLHEEPRDFYRYTKYGLRYLFEKAGFLVIECRPLSGFWVMMTQEFCYYLVGLRGSGLRRPVRWLRPALLWAIQRFGLLMNRLDSSERFSVEYLLIARKPTDLVT